MEKLKLHIKSDQPVTLEIPNPSDELKKHIVDAVLSKLILSNTVNLSCCTELTGMSFPLEVVSMADATPQPIQPERPFKELLAEDEARRAKQKENDEAASEDFYTTGIKIRNGKNCYKCRYKCTNFQCKQEGNHYVWEGTEEVSCHACNNGLKVKRATAEEELTRDPFGNFYVAGQRQPYHVINTY
jgi:hypothetical protein